jgi:hypothetical protein
VRFDREGQHAADQVGIQRASHRPYQVAAAPRITLLLTLWILGAGALVLFPSLIYLFRVFKPAPR